MDFDVGALSGFVLMLSSVAHKGDEAHYKVARSFSPGLGVGNTLML
jgi:hypothetical protein